MKRIVPIAFLLIAVPAYSQDPQEVVLQAQQLHQIVRYNSPPWISMIPLPTGVKEDIGAAVASLGLANSVMADAGGRRLLCRLRQGCRA